MDHIPLKDNFHGSDAPELVPFSDDNARKDNLPSRFFKALFCINEPLHGLLLAFGIMLMILPVSYFMLSMEQPLKERISTALGFTSCMLIYCFILNLQAILLLLKSMLKNKVLFTLCGIAGAFLPPLSYIIVSCHFLRKRQIISFALLDIAFILAILNCFHLLPYNWLNINHSFLMSIIIYAFAAAAMLLATKCKPKHLTAFAAVPPVIAIATMSLLLIRYGNCQVYNSIMRREISKKLGFSVEQKAYQDFISSGVELDKEPLASFMKQDSFQVPAMLNKIETYDIIPSFDAKKLQQLSSELNKKQYEKAVLEFTSVPPQKIAHKHDWEKQCAASIMLPELSKLRGATRFLALQIYSNPQNKELAIRNNAAMIALRDWALNENMLICTLVGIAIESHRLHAVCNTLPYIKYTDAEWELLLGKAPDWNKIITDAFGSELFFYENIKEYILKSALKSSRELNALGIEDDALLALPHYTPMTMWTILFEMDNSFALGYFKRAIELSLEKQHDYKELEQMVSSSMLLSEKGFILSAMLLPAIPNATRKIDAIKDLRHIANLARQVIAYDRQHGALPASLDLVSNDFKDSIDHNPFLFETKDLEVEGFRISAQYNKTETYSYSVKNFILIPYKHQKEK